MSDDNRLKDLEEKLASLDTERAKLILEINSLRMQRIVGKRRRLSGHPRKNQSDYFSQTPREKIDLFLKLFHSREDVYPKKWENF